MANLDTASQMRRRYALALMQQGMDASPVGHPLQALARALQGGMGGYMAGQVDRDETENNNKLFDAYLGPQGQAQPQQPQPVQQPPVQPQPVQPPGPMAEPRGIRNNNPLNIEDGPFARSQPGYAGTDGRFAKFAAADQGTGAAGNLLGVYNTKHGLNTVNGIVSRWAPAADGNNVSAYAKAVAGDMGVAPDQPLDMSNPDVKQALILAMGKHENGRPIQMAQPQAVPARTGAQIPPAELERIQRLRAVGTPQANQAALSILQQYSKSVDPKFHKLDDETLFEERTGRTVSAGPGYRSITDPAERARFGIPAEDKRPYQVRGGKLINPPPETRINIDQTAEKAFDTAAAKHQAERFDKIVQAGFEAKSQRADVTALRDISSRITTGKTAEMTAALGPYAEMLGVKIDGLGDMQAYKAIVAKIAPRMRPAGSGATSDFEMRQYLEAIPGLGKTPEGNAIIEATMEALQNHQEAAADIASRAMNKEISPREADKMLRALPDPLTAWKDSKKAGKLGEKTDDGWTTLPNGVRIREKK